MQLLHCIHTGTQIRYTTRASVHTYRPLMVSYHESLDLVPNLVAQI